jgi:hypothetical protein
MEIGPFLNLWKNQSRTLSNSQKNEMGKLYLEHIIGLPGDEIPLFLDGKLKQGVFVGSRNGGIEEMKNDYSKFWNGLVKISPNVYSKKEIAWLIEKGEKEAPWACLLEIDPYEVPNSEVIKKIQTNAHAYK